MCYLSRRNSIYSPFKTKIGGGGREGGGREGRVGGSCKFGGRGGGEALFMAITKALRTERKNAKKKNDFSKVDE